MKFRFFYGLFIMVFSAVCAQAQNLEIHNYNDLDNEKNTNFITKKLYLSDHKLIVLRTGGVYFSEIVFLAKEFYIDVYDLKGDCKLVKTVKYSFSSEKNIEKNFNPELTIVRNNRIYFFADFYNNKENIITFQVKQIDLDLNDIEDWKPILTFTDKEYITLSNWSYKTYKGLKINITPFGEKFYVSSIDFENLDIKRGEFTFESLLIKTFSNSFEEELSFNKKIEFNRKGTGGRKIGLRHSTQYDMLLTSMYGVVDGNLLTGYLIGDIKGLQFGASNNRLKFFEFYNNIEFHYSYDYEDDFRKVAVSLPKNVLWHNYSFVIDTLKQTAIFSGVYAEVKEKEYSMCGSFLFIIDLINGKKICETYTPFSDSIKTFTKNKVGKFSERLSFSKRKLDYHANISMLNNGNMLLLLEYLGNNKFGDAVYKKKRMLASGTICNDVLVVEYDNAGNIVSETTIDKQMYVAEMLEASSFTIIQKEGNVNIVFCDNRMNYNQAGEFEPKDGKVKKVSNDGNICLVSVSLDVDGKWKRKVLAEGFNKDESLPDIYFDKTNNFISEFILFRSNEKSAIGEFNFKQK